MLAEDDLIGHFYQCLLESIQAIGPLYYEVPRHQADIAIRERVYCYELYHQLRVRLGDNFPYKLHGEIDKRGHGFIAQYFHEVPNPDFVIHIPGTMDNLAVMEVKASDCRPGDARTDLQKLNTFISEIQYRIGFFLLFGPHDPSEMLESLDIPSQHICVLWHMHVGEPPSQLFPTSTG